MNEAEVVAAVAGMPRQLSARELSVPSGWFPVTLIALSSITGAWSAPVFSKEAADACLRQIPAALAKALEARYPTYRLPRVTDNLEEYVASNIRRGGSGCFGVSHADFDGDGTRDYVLILSSRTDDDDVVVVAALQKPTDWIIETITKSDTRSTSYVSIVRAGRFEHTDSFEPDTNAGDVGRLTCTNSGIVTGTLEASGMIGTCIDTGMSMI